jgi:hypothetical protein
MLQDLDATFMEGKKLGYSRELFRHLVNTAFYQYGKHLVDDPADYQGIESDILSAIKKAATWKDFDTDEAIAIVNNIGKNRDVGYLLLRDITQNLPRWVGANIKETEASIAKMKASATKLPEKKLKLEDTKDPISDIFVKAKSIGYTPHLFERLILTTLKEHSDMDTSYSPSLIFSIIREAVDKWPKFDYLSAVDVLRKLKKQHQDTLFEREIYQQLIHLMSKAVSKAGDVSQINSVMKSSSQKLPERKLKLEDFMRMSNG